MKVSAGPVAFDAPLDLTIGGADPSRPVRLTATATDSEHGRWASHADFTPSRKGTVDVRTSTAGNGTYQGVPDTGLVWSMGADDEHLLFASGDDATIRLTFSATQDGARPASASQQRWYRAPGVRVQVLNRSEVGFVGTMYTPAASGASSSAVLMLGGSEGGLPLTQPEALASRGHPALALAYFGVPGVPSTLTDIPLEYFATALRWLATQPGVDPARITVVGGSRGSEAAALLGVHYPKLVRSVALLSPSSIVNTALPDLSKPAWTFHGRPLPHVGEAEFGNTNPLESGAVIPVEKVRGPVFLLYGDQDQLWPSGRFVEAMTHRMSKHPHTVVREAGAGHLVDFLVPNLPMASNSATYRGHSETFGGTVQDDSLGRLDAWTKLLTFLSAL